MQEDLSSVHSTKRVSLFMGWHFNLLISCSFIQCPSTFVFVTLGRPQNCFLHIFSSFFSFVAQMRMMRVLEPQDQTSVLVIRVIEEVHVPVGKYILALRLVRSHFICIMNGMRKSLSLSSSSLYLIKQVNRPIQKSCVLMLIL